MAVFFFCQPFDLLGSLLGDAGWSLDVIIDVTADYARWCKNLAARLQDLKPELIQECGLETWEYAVNFYDAMYETLPTGTAEMIRHPGFFAAFDVTMFPVLNHTNAETLMNALKERSMGR